MEESIELREIIEIILKGKNTIFIITVICLLLTCLMNWIILPEKFESKAVLQIKSDVQETGIIENYVAAEFKPEVYMKRLKNEQLINSIFEAQNLSNKFEIENLSVSNDANTNLVNIVYTSNSPENAKQELQTIINTTKKEMNESVQESLIDLESTYKLQVESLSKEIESIINRYNSIIRENNLPDLLILQTILNSEIVLEINNEQTKALANVNGTLQNQLLQLQTQIQAKNDEYQKVLANYQSVKTSLDSFKPDPFIRVINEPTLEYESSSPNKVLNLIIGIVLGLMIGLGYVFFRNYWKNSLSV